MSRTITIPDDLYDRLDAEARAKGVSIEQLLRSWPANDEAPWSARCWRVWLPWAMSYPRYGEMPDSTELVREDRAR